MFPPDDQCWDLDLVHVLMQTVSRLLIDDFQKQLPVETVMRDSDIDKALQDLLGHFEADIGAELEHFAHLFWGGWDQGNLLHGFWFLQLFKPLYKLIVS